MAGDVYGGGESEAVAVRHDSDPREVATAEAIRTRFDCSGTIWSTHVRSDGKPTCHGMPFANGAPDVLSCTVRIEHQVGPGVYEIVPPGDKYAPDEVGEDFLLRLGGGRRYRLSLRKAGQTIPHSYLSFDLVGRCEKTPFPHERAEGGTATKTAPAAASGPLPSSSEILALGNDPWGAMIGASVAQMAPEARVMFALLHRDAQRAELWAQKTVDQSERLFSLMTGVMREAAKGGGGGEVAALLRAQVDSASKLAEQASRDATAAAQRLHEKELAEARASSANAPSPTTPLLINAGERLLGLAIETSIKTAGQEAVAKALGTVAGAAGAAVGAVGAAG